MTFTEHLAELRTRIIRSCVAILAGMLICYVFAEKILVMLIWPLQSSILLPGADPEAAKAGATWTYLNVLEPVMVNLKLAAYGGMLISSPYVIYQICAFIFPGLRPKEKRAVKIALFGCSVLVVIGVCVAYFGVFRVVLPYLMEFAPEGFSIQLRTSENIALIIKGLLAFALAFQFPMIVLILVYMDLLTPATLKKYRKIAIVGMAVCSAMLTPPDPFSMIVMLMPLVLLYEGSIWVSYLVARRPGKKADTAKNEGPK